MKRITSEPTNLLRGGAFDNVTGIAINFFDTWQSRLIGKQFDLATHGRYVVAHHDLKQWKPGLEVERRFLSSIERPVVRLELSVHNHREAVGRKGIRAQGLVGNSGFLHLFDDLDILTHHRLTSPYERQYNYRIRAASIFVRAT